MPPLLPPPVPQKLREMLKDYPEHIVRLQEALNRLVDTPSAGVGLFERAVWLIEGRLETFVFEARREIAAANTIGNSEKLARANAMRITFGKARMQLVGLLSGLQAHLGAEDGHGRTTHSFKRDTAMPHLLPPPVPQKLREMLAEYPEHIERLQEVLNRLAETSSAGVDPFDRAVWLLEGRLETFVSEARKEMEAAKAAGDHVGMERAGAKELLMLDARSLRGLHDLWEYVQVNRDRFA